ncbi:MAG: hypothetical protein ABFS86_01315, partial [Planctomycetota bacterium]
MRVVAVCLIVLLALPAVAGGSRLLLPAGEDLAGNPDFERAEGDFAKGWTSYRSPGGMVPEYGLHGIDGTKGVRFRCPETATGSVKPSSISRALTEFPAGQEIEVTAWLRLEKFAGTCVVWARCDEADGPQRREGAFENSALRGYDLTGTSRWSPVTVRVTPDEATKVVHVGVLAGGTGSILVHSIHARAPKAT